MDPEIVAAVVAALSAGALAGVEGSATKAVEGASAGLANAYRHLRDAVRGLFGDGSRGAAALDGFEDEPKAWEGGLTAELRKVEIKDPAALLALVEAVNTARSSTPAEGGQYSVHAYKSSGVVTGPNTTSTFYFDGRGDDTARTD